MGMLVKDVMQCFPNEVGELLHVVKVIVYNTPGPHGLTPRDIDRIIRVCAGSNHESGLLSHGPGILLEQGRACVRDECLCVLFIV